MDENKWSTVIRTDQVAWVEQMRTALKLRSSGPLFQLALDGLRGMTPTALKEAINDYANRRRLEDIKRRRAELEKEEQTILQKIN